MSAFVVRLVSLLIGYVCGSVLTADIVCRRCVGRPVSEVGSGNPGMANVMANVGTVPGIVVLVGDIAKTAIAMGVSYLVFQEYAAALYAGFGAIFGHNFPLWNRGRGGKGVTVTCVWLVLSFGWWGLLACIAGGIVVVFTGWLPLGAVVITTVAIPVAFLTKGTEAGVLSVIACVIMFSRHWHGLRRIVRGEEPAHMKFFNIKKKESTPESEPEAELKDKQK